MSEWKTCCFKSTHVSPFLKGSHCFFWMALKMFNFMIPLQLFPALWDKVGSATDFVASANKRATVVGAQRLGKPKWQGRDSDCFFCRGYGRQSKAPLWTFSERIVGSHSFAWICIFDIINQFNAQFFVGFFFWFFFFRCWHREDEGVIRYDQ